MEMVNVKTWIKTRIVGVGGSNSIANRDLFVKIKDYLKTHGWSVVSSSDGISNVGAEDYWIDYTKIVNAVEGSNHSWIVMSNSSICSGYQLCIDFSLTTVTKLYAYVSVDGGGFTGGSITSRPTAVDEAKININTDNWTSYTIGTEPTANVWTSSDYTATKVVLGPTSVMGVWWFMRPTELVHWWVKPNISMINSGTCIHADHNSLSEDWSTGIVNGKRATFVLGTLMIGTTRALTTAGVAGSSGDFGGLWPTTPMWILSVYVDNPGLFGFVPDQWWMHNNATLVIGDTFPSDGSGQQVVIGNMAFGNNGTDLIL